MLVQFQNKFVGLLTFSIGVVVGWKLKELRIAFLKYKKERLKQKLVTVQKQIDASQGIEPGPPDNSPIMPPHRLDTAVLISLEILDCRIMEEDLMANLFWGGGEAGGLQAFGGPHPHTPATPA
ncbi:hypothetical protein M8J75_010239 [Diaphorina citri]|nr:hypothetical protein M8J75_010239 [Diaphorina citri]